MQSCYDFDSPSMSSGINPAATDEWVRKIAEEVSATVTEILSKSQTPLCQDKQAPSSSSSSSSASEASSAVHGAKGELMLLKDHRFGSSLYEDNYHAAGRHWINRRPIVHFTNPPQRYQHQAVHDVDGEPQSTCGSCVTIGSLRVASFSTH